MAVSVVATLPEEELVAVLEVACGLRSGSVNIGWVGADGVRCTG